MKCGRGCFSKTRKVPTMSGRRTVDWRSIKKFGNSKLPILDSDTCWNAHGYPPPFNGIVGSCGVYWRPLVNETCWAILPLTHAKLLSQLRSQLTLSRVQTRLESSGLSVLLTALLWTPWLNTGKKPYTRSMKFEVNQVCDIETERLKRNFIRCSQRSPPPFLYSIKQTWSIKWKPSTVLQAPIPLLNSPKLWGLTAAHSSLA